MQVHGIVRNLVAQPILGLIVLSACVAHATVPAASPAPKSAPTSALAPTPAPALTPAAARTASPAPAGRLEHALDVVKTENIRSDEFFIASDELGGRDTPSNGQRVAARYIRARLERLGWHTGARDGYFFKYILDQHKLDEDASNLEWKHGEEHGTLHFGGDYLFTSTFDCKELTASGGVVFCGDAAKADFEKSGVSGKWALCLDDGTELRKLRAPAKGAGAIGVILAAGPAYSGDPYEKRFAKELDRQRRGYVSPRKQAG
jgi:hypothetical protein